MEESKKKKKEKKYKKVKKQTLGSSKTAQTQLKTTLRNHIDLSVMADNKANIMLSVNAVIITVGLPLLIDRLSTDKNMMIPIIVLATSSSISMIFATLSTRPIKMHGRTNLDRIKEQKTNLFFFGNFYKMSFDDYEKGLKTVIADDQLIENSITRDLFFLGKSIGEKFEYLRICYNFFMFGMLLTVLAFFAIVYLK